ncbi:MAG: TonB-dependent receptor, partial [Candidatus Eremiobacteraeota bacterium]|nr:TonB-dependent receptor [Candidatus Eremiobacteraeota bacterium]
MRRLFALVLVVCVLPLRALAADATVVGSVQTAGGLPVPGARIVLTGPVQTSAYSAADGSFSVTAPEGIYRVEVTKGGYNPATLSDYSALAGGSAPLAITLTAASLESLQTIGHVTVVSRGVSQINTGAAPASYVSAQAFQNLAAPQINDVLQHVPDINVEHMGSQPDTTIILNGAQPYETQVLIDGHPVALGQYGVWSSQFFPSWLLGGVEAQSGPGNTTPFANIAVAGTVNLLTPGYTARPTSELVVGTDNYSAQYSHLLTTGSANKLGWVLGIGYGSYNGPYYQGKHCDVVPDNTANENTPANVAIVQFCSDTSGSLFQKSALAKFKYDFSPATSLELGYVGTFGGFLPQGISYATYLGRTQIVQCLPSSPLSCTNPADANLIGQTIPAYTWYPGSNAYFNQPMFNAQLRTSIGSGTLLIRPYAGNIEPDVINGLAEGQYPQYFSPPGMPPSAPSGTAIPSSGFAGGGNAFEQQCGVNVGAGAFTQINSPSNTVTVVNGQEECYQFPFSEFEIDKLYGGTASFLQPIGTSLLNLTYDYHSTDTFAYYNSPNNIAVPDSTERYTTLALTGELHFIQNLAFNLGLYDTTWKLNGVQPELSNGAPVTDANGNPILQSLTRSVSRLDPHVAAVFRPRSDLAYRVAYGVSNTFPYAGQVSGIPFYQPPSATTNFQSFLLQKNPYLNPETSIGWNVGADKRLRNGAVASLDLQDTVIHDVFQSLTFPSSVAN